MKFSSWKNEVFQLGGGKRQDRDKNKKQAKHKKIVVSQKMASFLNKDNKVFNSHINTFLTLQSKSGSSKVVPKKDNAPLGNGPLQQPLYKAEDCCHLIPGSQWEPTRSKSFSQIVFQGPFLTSISLLNLLISVQLGWRQDGIKWNRSFPNKHFPTISNFASTAKVQLFFFPFLAKKNV